MKLDNESIRKLLQSGKTWHGLKTAFVYALLGHRVRVMNLWGSVDLVPVEEPESACRTVQWVDELEDGALVFPDQDSLDVHRDLNRHLESCVSCGWVGSDPINRCPNCSSPGRREVLIPAPEMVDVPPSGSVAEQMVSTHGDHLVPMEGYRCRRCKGPGACSSGALCEFCRHEVSQESGQERAVSDRSCRDDQRLIFDSLRYRADCVEAETDSLDENQSRLVSQLRSLARDVRSGYTCLWSALPLGKEEGR